MGRILILALSRAFLPFLVAPIAFASSVGWDVAVTEMNRSNPQIRAASANVDAARHSGRASMGLHFPQLSADASAGINGGGNSSSSRVYSIGLTVTQNVFSGLRNHSLGRVQSAEIRRTEAALENVRAAVTHDLKSAFASLAYAREITQLAAEIKKRRDTNLQMVRLRFEGGNENRGSLLLSQAYLSQAHLDELEAKNAVRIAVEQLARTLGRSSLDASTIDTRLLRSEPPQNPDFERLAMTSPLYYEAVAQLEAAQSRTLVARSSFFPSVSITGGIGRQGTTWFPNNDRWSLSSALSIPLFTGGQNFNSYRSEVSTEASAEARLQDVTANIRSRLVETHSKWQEAAARERVDLEFEEAARKRAEISRRKYNNGLVAFDSWDLIENELIQRQRAAVRSRREAILAEAGWELALGKGYIR